MSNIRLRYEWNESLAGRRTSSTSSCFKWQRIDPDQPLKYSLISYARTKGWLRNRLDPFTLLFGHNNPAAYWISERAYLKDENRESIQYCSSSARSQFLLYDRRLPVQLNPRMCPDAFENNIPKVRRELAPHSAPVTELMEHHRGALAVQIIAAIVFMCILNRTAYPWNIQTEYSYSSAMFGFQNKEKIENPADTS
ncbi:hypothetical protein EAG_13938 [Camponotus floridanus]|uniref:Uncharacterized protein n=1 Tax=Camponotus floridanus TaxID=104421 RepID=E2ABD9_CAMFO|nr:hypothetical protein EAG_13938 [Camponotus floridanus]